MKVTVTRVGVEAGDWEGIYINDTLKSECHRHDSLWMLELLKGLYIVDYYNFTVSDDWIENEAGRFPQCLMDIPNGARV